MRLQISICLDLGVTLWEGLWFSRLTQLSSRYHLRDNLFEQKPIRLRLPGSRKTPPPKSCQAFDGTPCPRWGSAIIMGDRQQRPQLQAAGLSVATSDVGDIWGEMEFLLIQPLWNGPLGWRFDLFSSCFSHGMEGGEGLPGKSLNHALYHWIMHSTNRFQPALKK